MTVCQVLNAYTDLTSKLTARSIGKSDVIKGSITSEAAASYGFKLHLENDIITFIKSFNID